MELGRYQSGQLGQTVTLLTYVFVGSNPALPTTNTPTFVPQKGGVSVFKSESSSVGRAKAFQALGRGFEPRLSL